MGSKELVLTMEQLVTLDEARAHILLPPIQSGSPSTADEKDQALKLASAQDIIIQYIGANADDDWDADSVPPRIKAAILILFAELVRFRGDEQQGEGPEQTDGNLSPQLTNLLRRDRDPVLS